METTLKYNNYSKEFAPKSLAKGQVARFRVIGSEARLQSLLQLPYEDYVWDDGKQEMIAIGAIKRLKAEGKPEFYLLHLNENQQKCWVLMGGNAEHNEIYRFLQKCNYNKSNPDRNTSNEPLIEEYDANSAVKTQKNERDLKRAAVNAAASMSDKEVRAHYGNDQLTDIDSLRMRLEDEAFKNPTKFTEKKESKLDIDIKELVRMAEEKKIIVFDQELNQWTDSEDNLLLKCGKGVGRGKYVDFAKWIESGDGKDMMDIIIEGIS